MKNVKPFNKYDKVKLFSHVDLDGYGCNILAKISFDNVDVENYDYNRINEKIGEFIDNELYKNYDYIFITDISVNGEIAKRMDSLFSDKVFLLDHHPTALWMNDIYDWAYVDVGKEHRKMCGTYLLYQLLKPCFFKEWERYENELFFLVEEIRRYDTWEWYNIYNDNTANEINQLLHIIGEGKFVSKYVNSLLNVNDNDEWVLFDNLDVDLLDIEHMKKESYIYQKEKQITHTIIKGRYVGVVFAEQYHSELGNRLSTNHPEFDFIAIINLGDKKVSLRTTKDGIDLGKDVASLYGGGGHFYASGFQIKDHVVLNTIESIFKI